MRTIANWQVQSCTERDIGMFANAALMGSARERSVEMLDALVEHAGIPLSAIAVKARMSPSTLTRYRNDDTIKHELSTPTLEKLRAAFPTFYAVPGRSLDSAPGEYLSIAVMPTFGGMGGGGTGDDDETTALMPRYLIEDQLRAKAKDLLLLEVRGDSMEPEFLHGDQILVDRRDVDPRQPGAFAMFDGDGIVIKLVERVQTRRGYYRVFSANPRYTEYEISEEDITIMGRPVWFARRI